MSVSLNFDNQTKEAVLEIERGKTLIERLNLEELRELMEEIDYLKNFHWHEINNFYQVELEDIEYFLDSKEKRIDDIKQIDIVVYKMTRMAPGTETWIGIKFKDGKKDCLWDIQNQVNKNFPYEKVWKGKISTHELRASFNDDVLDVIRQNPDIILSFCGKIIPKEIFFNEREVLFYEAEECGDT